MRQIGHLHVGLWMHGDRDPTPEEWTAGCQAFRQLAAGVGDNPSTLRALIISDGAAPNAQQRAEFFRTTPVAQYPAAVITRALDNPIKRGVVTAITWTNPRFRAFAPDGWWHAFQHVGLEDKIARVWSEFVELQSLLPRNQTFEHIARAQSAEALRAAANRARPAGA